MNASGQDRQVAELVFQYAQDPMFRSAHADGFVGGLTPNGHIHLAFYSERSRLPKKHGYKLNPDGSIGSEVADEKASREPIMRDILVDIRLTVHAAEGLKNWLDQYIKNLKPRPSGAPSLVPIPVEPSRTGGGQ